MPNMFPIMRAWLLRQGFGQVPFINIHDLNLLTAELARLLGTSLPRGEIVVNQA
jgi:hypothetical protein